MLMSPHPVHQPAHHYQFTSNSISSGSYEEPDETVVRLHTSKKGYIRPEKTANDGFISDLPSETLRWIKKRRDFTSDKKVVLSYHRERQLREIFQGIDIGKNGAIDLKEVHEAVSYVQMRLKHVKGLEKFRNIQSVFAAMDDNGDGTVDFQEFTNAMTGSSDSALDTTSEHEIEKLYRCFVEFGVLKHRKHAIDCIAEYTGYTVNKGNKKHMQRLQMMRANLKLNNSFSEGSVEEKPPDVDCYNMFKTLFGNEESTFVTGNASAAADQILADKKKEMLRLAVAEDKLEQFLEDHKHTQDWASLSQDIQDKENEYTMIQDKLKTYRKTQQELLAADPDAVALQVRLLEEKRLAAASLQKRNGGRPQTASNTIRKTTIAPVTLVPLDPNSRQDQNFKQSARKDAYNIVRSNRNNPIEFRNRCGSASLDRGDEGSVRSKLSFRSTESSKHSAHSTGSQLSQTHSIKSSQSQGSRASQVTIKTGIYSSSDAFQPSLSPSSPSHHMLAASSSLPVLTKTMPAINTNNTASSSNLTSPTRLPTKSPSVAAMSARKMGSLFQTNHTMSWD